MQAIALDSGPVYLVIHRDSSGIETERVSDSAYGFLQRLFAGAPLDAVLDGAPSDSCMLIAQQFAKGRLTGVRREIAGEGGAA